MLQVLYLDVSKVDRVLHLLTRLLLLALVFLLAFCYLASFSDCIGGVAGADGGGAPRDGGANTSVCSPFCLQVGSALVPSVFCYAGCLDGIVLLVGHDASPDSVGRAVFGCATGARHLFLWLLKRSYRT